MNATDGEIGNVVSFLLDDEQGAVHYLIVQTGGFLALGGREVLISPVFFRQVATCSRNT